MWKFSTSGPVFSSCLTYTRTNGDFITFGCHNHHSYHLKHIEDGNVQEEFRNKHSSQIFATPFKFKDSYIVYAATDGHLQIIDFVDKQIVCEIKLPGELFSTPLVLGDEIFIGCRDNYLYCLNVSILWKIKRSLFCFLLNWLLYLNTINSWRQSNVIII